MKQVHVDRTKLDTQSDEPFYVVVAGRDPIYGRRITLKQGAVLLQPEPGMAWLETLGPVVVETEHPPETDDPADFKGVRVVE
jgi:hypothetical protein